MPPKSLEVEVAHPDIRSIRDSRIRVAFHPIEICGRARVASLIASPLKDATLWTGQFRRTWEARFEALDSLLDEMKSDEKTRSRRR